MNGNDNNDFRNVQASVIGELRKDKIGRPMLAVQLIVIFLIVVISLPLINNMLDSEDGIIYKLFNGSSSSGTNTETSSVTSTSEYLDATIEQSLNSQTSMKFENLILKKFILSGDKITVTMSSYNGILNLDQKEYYLYLYSSSGNLLSHIKLTGSYDNSEKTVDLTSYGLSFNTNMSYKGKVVEMTDRDYPDVEMYTDESGVGSFTCTMGNRSIEYVFKNNYLIQIKDSYSAKIADQATSDDYLNLKRVYDEKSANLGSVATNEEDDTGFTFTANMDLEAYRIPDSVTDYDYYTLDTEAKIINYAETGKGFDCK